MHINGPKTKLSNPSYADPRLSSKDVPTHREYFEQEEAVARRYLAGGATLQASARRLADIASAMLRDDDAWAELERPGDGSRGTEPAGELHWFGALVPDASEEDQRRLRELLDRAMTELRKRDGLTSA